MHCGQLVAAASCRVGARRASFRHVAGQVVPQRAAWDSVCVFVYVCVCVCVYFSVCIHVCVCVCVVVVVVVVVVAAAAAAAAAVAVAVRNPAQKAGLEVL